MTPAPGHEKIDLSADAIPGLAWRRIRDAFRRIGFKAFDEAELAAWLFRNQLLDELDTQTEGEQAETPHRSGASRRRNVNAARELLRGEARDERSPTAHDALDRTRKVLCLLHDGAFIEKHPWQGAPPALWKLTRKGHALRMQKALRRIPMHQAREIIARVIDEAECMNCEADAAFAPTRLWIYGSYLRGARALGDVDLIADIAACPGETAPPPEGCPRATRRPVRTIRDALLRLRVSPYVSITHNLDWLRELERRGEPLRMIWMHRD
ncbi:hypothetical protein GGQ74_000210 [Desulfobaculum xiamenense]|uniref:Nucleotidyltransferase domain-containing protein n=1 Tax=Desulfobaculum xiamenense TaxID=995050 RepID=A0A846QHH7_9BACT|nr:hypothetical protein [Desulfobaculum xiamenense]NJB66570.1 hypothetical protein [Desulfobaculum xiamenense]